MTIKTKIACIAVAAAVAFSGTAASAATFTIGTLAKGTTTFGNSDPVTGNFLDTFLFGIPSNGRATVTITSTQNPSDPARTNVNFNATGVRFNGVVVPFLQRGVFELRTLVGAGVTGPAISTLVVRGTSGSLGQYTGSITYTIPEPALWGMMILGMGVAGASMRVRRRKIAFAM